MSVVIPYTFVAGNKARASEVNANFAAISAKFTEGAGGIKDEDISSSAGIRRTKLSTSVGSRITEAQMEDGAVDSRVLKSDAGGANGAVGSADHIKDAIITNAKIVNGTIKSGKLDLASVLVVVPFIGSPIGVTSVDTTLLSSSAFPIFCHAEGVAAATGAATNPTIALDTGTGKYWLNCMISDPVTGASSYSMRVWYIRVT